MLRRVLVLFILSLLGVGGALAQEATAPAAPAPAAAPVAPDPALLRYLNVRYAGAGRFSADGQWLAFTTNWTGTAQKWRIPVDGGFPQQITFLAEPADYCDYSPHDPQLMLLGFDAGGNEKTQLYFTNPEGTLLEPFAVDLSVVHRGGDWSRDGKLISYADNSRDAQYFDIYVADLQTGERRRVVQADANLGCGAFAPDAGLMLYYDNYSNFDRDVYALDLETGAQCLLTPHSEPVSYSSFNWADNHTLYFLSNEGREFTGLARKDLLPYLADGWPADSRAPGFEWVHAPERDIEDLNVSDDGRYIAWTENADGFGEVHIATLPELRELPPPAIPRGVQRVGSFDRQTRYLMLQASGPEGPTDLWRYELATGATLRLTYSATGGIDPASFVQPRAVHYPSFDGLTISALLYEPPGTRPAGGWPTLIVAHGGPEGQSRPWFDPQTQLYLSKGIAVLLPNVRGSEGFGRRFFHLDDVALREDSIADYAAARDWLAAEGIADPARIAISGASYGGYAVLAALTLYPDKWAGGVCSVGISNFVTFLENTAAYRRSVREAEYGSLERDREFLASISPIHKVERITAPLLIVHGANDPRVPLSEAQQMHDALKALGREVELLVFPDEGHGIARLENRAVAWERELRFLEAALKMER